MGRDLAMANDGLTPWRKLATAVYTGPKDCRIYGTVEIDVSDTMEYIFRMREKGTKVTLTHFVAAAIARCLHEDIPEINCFIRRGKVVSRESADVFVSVALERGRDLTGILIPETHRRTVSDIESMLTEEIQKRRSGEDPGPAGARQVLAKAPWPLRRVLFLLVKWWVYDLGWKFPFLNIPRDPFGSIVLSNIGTHGLTTGMAALFPIGRVPAVIVMGKVVKKPIVKDDEIVIRSVLPLTATMDHRIVDGAQAGALARGLERRLKNPGRLNQLPESME